MLEPKPTTSEEMETEEFLRRMRTRFDECEQAETDNRTLALEDIQFRNGDQWPEDVKQERTETGRPMFTINKMEQTIDLITGMSRQNTPSIKVRPILLGEEREDAELTNVKGDKSYKRAEVYQGIVRDIQNASMAARVYQYTLDQSSGSGFGYIRVHTDYVSDDVFEQEIRIKRVKNQFTVYMDPDAQGIVKEDAKFLFITEWLGKEDAKKRFPKGFDEFEQGTLGEGYEKWYKTDAVRVAEYYWCEQKRDTLYLLADGTVVGEDDYNKMKDQLPTDSVIRKRAVVRPKWQWAYVSGRRMLEGPYEWPSRYPCVIPVYGKELNVEGKTVYRGAIRFAKDPQRLYNYWRTTTTETVALAPKAPYLADIRTIENYQHIWKTANTKNHAFLPYDSASGGQKPERAQPPAVPQAAIAETQQADIDIQATTGFYNPSLGRGENQNKSGRAIIAEQTQGAVSTSDYHDNLAVSVMQVGRVIVDLIPRIYDTERVVRMGFADETEDFVRINQEITDDKGETTIIHDLTAGRYDVMVDVGPEFKTARIEAIEGMKDLVGAAPQLALILAPIMAKNLDWPGADEIEQTIKKFLPQLFGPAQPTGQPGNGSAPPTAPL